MNIDYIRENYMTAPQAAKYLGITRNRVGRLCLEGRFAGAGKIDDIWLIPRESVYHHRRLKPGELKADALPAVEPDETITPEVALDPEEEDRKFYEKIMACMIPIEPPTEEEQAEWRKHPTIEVNLHPVLTPENDPFYDIEWADKIPYEESPKTRRGNKKGSGKA